MSMLCTTLAELSEGIPRQTANLADNSLVLGFYHQQPVIGVDIVQAAAADRERSLGKEPVHAAGR